MSAGRIGKEIEYVWSQRNGKYSALLNNVRQLEKYCQENPAYQERMKSRDWFYILQMPKKCSDNWIKFGISTASNENNILKRLNNDQKHYSEDVKIIHIRLFDKRRSASSLKGEGQRYNIQFEKKIKQGMKEKYGLPKQTEWIKATNKQEYMRKFRSVLRSINFDDVIEEELSRNVTLRKRN